MLLDINQITELQGRFGTPFYVFDEGAFCRNFDEITAAFSERYEKFLLAYSYKTNYIPYLCGIIRYKGGWAEVVSRMEYDLALKVGQQPNKIVFNGPVKHYEDIERNFQNEERYQQRHDRVKDSKTGKLDDNVQSMYHFRTLCPLF